MSQPSIPSPHPNLSDIRVRFAPSPTGYLHVGGARTALFNWLYARKTGGKFILRIEDTDQVRSTAEALRMQIGDLKWLGLDWDEGPEVGGPYAPYQQSQRQHIYKEHADRLFASGQAYYCFCTDEELEKKKEVALKEGRPPHYDGKCRSVSHDEAQTRRAKGEKGAVRFHIKKQKDYALHDLIRGEVKFPAGMVGDFILLRSDGMPVYNFCCVIDDALMKISHVIRAEEHLSNTVRQIMLFEAFGYPVPLFGHASIILDSDRQKLSKRKGATSCNEFKNAGYLPEALKNFIALLGWSSPSGKEVMTEAEMISDFGLDRFTSSAAVFDDNKLRWMNATHLRALAHDELWKRLEPFFAEAGLQFSESAQWKDHALSTLKTSMETLVDAVPLFKLLSPAGFSIEAEGAETLKWEGSRAVVEAWKNGLEKQTEDRMSESDFLSLQEAVKTQTGAKGKTLFMPIRVCVIGKPHGTELKLIVPLIERGELIRRAQECLLKA